MKTLTILLIIIYNAIFLYEIIKKKNFFGLGTIINFAVNFNFILYMLKWSDYIKGEIYYSTYIVMDSMLIVFIIIMLLSKSNINELKAKKRFIILKDKKIFKDRISIYLIINTIYILLFLIENYMGSNNLAPYLFGIDIHTYSAPLISFITRCLFVMLFINYICHENFKQKRYIIFALFDICLFLLFRGARINVFMAIIQFILFYLIYNFYYITKNKKKVIVIFTALMLFVCIGVSIGNRRISKNLEGNALEGKATYSDFIKYSGPVDPIKIMPWYYGYFPMSYANLNQTIKYIDENNLRTYGIYTVRPILVGLFELDNFVEGYKDIKYASSLAQYYTEAATVRTGFMEFYLDFGDFMFVSILIYALIGVFFYNGIKKNIYFSVYYSFYGGCWFFMSFQNLMIDVTTLYTLIYLYLIYKFLVKKQNCNQLGDGCECFE